MRFLRRCLLLLLLLLGGVALLVGRCSGSSTHSLRYFKVAVSDPGQGLPHFLIVGYLDDQLFFQYDSNTRKMLPRVPWIRKVELEDPRYWDKQTYLSRNWERFFREELWNYHNHSQGFHIWQWAHGCQLSPDGGRRGHMQFGFDGRDFLSLDLKRLVWIGADSAAQSARRKWNADVPWTQDLQHFANVVCLTWLQKFLEYAEESQQRTECPVVRVARKEVYDGQETLVCRAYGFYPKEIEVTWTKDGVDHMQDTLTGGVVPNSDGTYHKWLSIEVDPKDRERYQCHVGHDSLEKPLDLAWEEPVNVGLIVGVLVGVLLAAALLVGRVVIYMKKCNRPVGGYKATPGSEQGSDTSIQAEEPPQETQFRPTSSSD